MLLVFSLTASSQNKKSSYFKVTQDECIKRSGYTLVLKQVKTDSRCPEGLNCIWMGEAEVIVSVYNNRKLVEDVVITFAPKNVLENNDWFAKYSKDKYKNIRNLSLVPYPKKDIVIKPTDYYLKIEYFK
jgi:hypothetical protein